MTHTPIPRFARFLFAALLVVVTPTVAWAQLGSVPNVFSAGTVISSSSVNANFSAAFANALNRTGGTMTGTLTLSGTAANIILGSNYVSGDGDDEGISIDSSGVVTISSLSLTTLTCTGCVGATQLAATAVSAASYGGANSIATFTVDADGRLTAAAGVTPQIPIATGVTGLGTGVATWLATPSSSNLASALTNETGSGAAVFGTAPTLVTPNVTGTTAGAMSIAGNLYSHVLLAVGFQGTSPLNEPHQVGVYSAIEGNSSTGTGVTGAAVTDGYVIGFETALETDAGAATVPWAVNYSIGAVTKGSGDTVVRTIGLQSIDETAGTHNAFIAPFYSFFTGNWYIYYDGSRPSRLGEGALTIGNEVYRSANDDYIRVSGGNGAGTGASMSLYGGTHASAANKAFVTASAGFTVTGATSLVGNTAVTGTLGVTGDTTMGAEMYRSVNNGYSRISGGNGAGTGASMILYGGAHATNANQVSLAGSGGITLAGSGGITLTGATGITGNTTVTGTFTVTSDTVLGTELYRASADSYLRVAGGTSAAGASLVLYGQSHASAANKAALWASGGFAVTGPASVSSWFALASGQAMYWDGITGVGNTYTYESASDTLLDVVGNVPTFERTQGTIRVLGSEGSAASLRIDADESDDTADRWTIQATTGGELYVQNASSTPGPTTFALGVNATSLYASTFNLAASTNGSTVIEITAMSASLPTDYVRLTTDTSGNLSVTFEGASARFRVPYLASSSGTRYVCSDTDGDLEDSTTACSGTDAALIASIPTLQQEVAALRAELAALRAELAALRPSRQ